MRKRTLALVTVIVANMLFLSGCWNYREVDKLVIVAGIAIDKNVVTNKYQLTFETLKSSTGKEGKTESELIESEGYSIFDAIRNTIKTSGKKLYWSHAETVVISQVVAKEGIVPILDILGREPEPRINLFLLISKAETAKEILTKKASSSEITSFSINKIVKGSKDNTQSITAELYKVVDDLDSEGVSTTIPTITVIKNMDKETLDVSGVAIFKRDKLVGFLSDIETRPFLYAKNDVTGGVICFKVTTDVGDTIVTLEIEKSKSKIKPVYIDGKIVVNIDINTIATIVELDSAINLLDEEGIADIKYFAQKDIENSVQSVVKKVQNDYDADIFGFAESIKNTMPSHWREVKDDWGNYFKNLEVNVNSEVDITSSDETRSPIKVSD